MLAADIAVVAVAVIAADVVEQAGADIAAGVVVLAAEAGSLLVQPHPAVYMPGKCGSTTAYIVLHNSMDYCKLDIGSF